MFTSSNEEESAAMESDDLFNEDIHHCQPFLFVQIANLFVKQ